MNKWIDALSFFMLTFFMEKEDPGKAADLEKESNKLC